MRCLDNRGKREKGLELSWLAGYLWFMRRFLYWLSLICCFASAAPLPAASGSVIKVLPHFLDSKGRHTITPNLFERDSYQVYLRKNPKLRSGMRFDIQWKSKGPVSNSLKLKVEMRGIAQGDLPKQFVLEQKIAPSGWLGSWTSVPFIGTEYKAFGEVTSWRVTLWDSDQLLGQQQSFLW